MKFITTPIYYANDKPHIGSTVTTLAADVLARFWRLKGQDVFFLTGTDEHGAKIAEAAEKAGQTPDAFVAENAQRFQEAWEAINIKPDGFIRTTNEAHKQYVQAFLQDLYDKGHIYKGEYTGWYCVGCEEFKTASQIGPNNTCLIHLRPLVELSEEAYHFKLSAFETQIKEAIETGAFAVEPEARKNEVLSFIQEGLRDVAISRKNVAWGIPLPWDESHTVYVWVDALLNYLSVAEGNVFDGAKPTFPPAIQLIGKDILRFHAVIWPGLLFAAEKPLPAKLCVHGYFTVDGQKMSKSLGNVIAPADLIGRYGVDGARYLLIKEVTFSAGDSDITWQRFDDIYTSELANNVGNLVSRVTAMISRYRDDEVPEVTKISYANLVAADYFEGLEQVNFQQALARIQSIADELNSYIEESKPWALAKEGKGEELDVVLASLAENIYRIGTLLAPFLPDTATKILGIFGSSIAEINYDTLNTANHTAGITIQPCEALFPRLAEAA
jgi:methionyl-tRNA synthetase